MSVNANGGKKILICIFHCSTAEYNKFPNLKINTFITIFVLGTTTGSVKYKLAA